MLYLLLATVSNALLSVALKVIRSDRGNRFGVILGNYLTCILVSLFVIPDKGKIFSCHPETLLIGVTGGFFFVAGLVAMQYSIPKNGVSLTTAFSKLGLIVSVALSIFWFGEMPGVLQIIGIVFVIIAMVLIHSDNGSSQTGNLSAGSLVSTLLFCGGSGAMAKVYEQFGVREEDGIYMFYVFFTAAILTLILAYTEYRKTGKKILLSELAGGIAVGIPNYFSSYLLLKSLVGLPAVFVYPTYSTGAILIVILISAVCFKERLEKQRVLGIICILAALVFLNLPH